MAAPTPKEIREAYKDYRNAWQEVRDEAAADMQAISPEGPWTSEDRAARENAGRPCIHLDQLNQFLNQYCGNLRKNKRAVQLTPKGNGANDQDAARRSSLIQGIEERSNAPSAAYIPAAENAAMRSYGFAVIRTEYKDESSFDQEILIKPVLNPDTVLMSPEYKQPDASDVPDAFLLDLITRKSYKEKYPKAKITDFQGEVMQEPNVGDWIKEKYVQIAEYWKVESELKTLLLVESQGAQLPMLKMDWERMGKPGKVLREREVETPKVVQYMTNGLEILDTVPWAGSRIPIISCLGPERWINQAGMAKRELLSMTRFARDPQMFLDYLASGEAEEAGQIPKAPFVGAKGQFDSDQETWEAITKLPAAYVQYDIVTDQSGQNLLPPPSRPVWTPSFQEWEIAKDAATRAVQASMGITPLPDAAQRRGQKSGVALQKIDSMESLGSFHFVDRFENGFLHNMGWQLNELLKPILDTQREMPVAKPDGSRDVLHVVGNTSHPMNEQGAYDAQGLPDDHIHTGKGEFDVTISTGPDDASQREEQDNFVDQLMTNMQTLPPPGSPGAKILALGIRMRPTLGPIGKQIADVLDPPDPSNLPPEAKAVVTQLQGQLQAAQQELQMLHMERAGKVLEQQTKIQVEGMKGKHQLSAEVMKMITDIVRAELAAKSKANEAQAQADAQKELDMLGFDHQQIDRAHQAAHEVGMEGLQHGNAMQLADKQAQVAAAQQASQQVHEQGMAEQAAENQPGK